jgi:hypothetical protein
MADGLRPLYCPWPRCFRCIRFLAFGAALRFAPPRCRGGFLMYTRATIRPNLYIRNVSANFAFWGFSEVQGLGRLRLRIQQTHRSHLGPRIEPEVLNTLILYFVVAHH